MNFQAVKSIYKFEMARMFRTLSAEHYCAGSVPRLSIL